MEKIKEYKFLGTEITNTELTEWIMKQRGADRINELRYYGSRRFGLTKPRPDSDVDVYLLMDEAEDEDFFSKGPLFTEMYKGVQVEFHTYTDFHDGWQPDWISNAENELE